MPRLKTPALLPAAFIALATVSAPAFAERGVAVTIENKTTAPLSIEYRGADGGHFGPTLANVGANSSERITGAVSVLSRWDIVGIVRARFGGGSQFCFAGRNPSIGYPLFTVSDDWQKQDDGQNPWTVCKTPNWLTGNDDGKKFSTDESATFNHASIKGSVVRKGDSDDFKEFVVTIDALQ